MRPFFPESVSFTRPANTTAYASADLIANNATAGSVTPLSFSPHPNGRDEMTGCIRWARLSSTSTTGLLAVRAWLFTGLPTVTNGDNGALVPSQRATFLGTLAGSVDKVFTDGSAGVLAPETVIELPFQASTIYVLLQATGAYTPISAEVFTFAPCLYILQ